MSATSETLAQHNEALDAPVHIGAVSLRVRDLPGLTTFYRDAIGLSVLSQDADHAVLGAGGEPLVKLEAGARHPSSAAGLFHMAILLPSRRDLGNWLRHAAETRIGLEGASNHLVSEALYLSDPEGNGIEIYRDRSRPEWPRLDGGRIAMATERLDLDALLRDAEPQAYAGMPEGTVMGHVHLRVGDVQQAEGFYRDALGFEVMVHYPGASFMATGGYHHHIAANTWHSRGAGPRRDNEAGLSSFELVARDAEAHSALSRRLAASGGDAGSVVDPWGNRVTLRD
ncbi:VOC family protein [Bosea sp. (in: a-proteobacteria)]|uniref:VOC family protein n=1 Tax=Bosea sp. (in: a-proteobacteria) TaxID=1871050 RepID=UPI002DDCCFDA|nr:VOC family protein [Bosea sp. (in: a-proteobacteria)]HEV2512326.1 VOC family protein [Bosea sp. (in: a-proteobacteria)]